MTKNEAKKIVGDYILKAMKGIDEALAIIHLLPDDYSKEITQMQESKDILKKVLNKHFDTLALQKSKN